MSNRITYQGKAYPSRAALARELNIPYPRLQQTVAKQNTNRENQHISYLDKLQISLTF